MTDRRAGRKQGPYVGKQPRTRTQKGTWRKKRSDTGKKRDTSKSKTASKKSKWFF